MPSAGVLQASSLLTSGTSSRVKTRWRGVTLKLPGEICGARGPQLSGHATRVSDDEVKATIRRIGLNVHNRRLELGIPITELAAASGVSFTAICAIERGGRGTRRASGTYIGTLVRLARALDISPSELLP